MMQRSDPLTTELDPWLALSVSVGFVIAASLMLFLESLKNVHEYMVLAVELSVHLTTAVLAYLLLREGHREKPYFFHFVAIASVFGGGADFMYFLCETRGVPPRQDFWYQIIALLYLLAWLCVWSAYLSFAARQARREKRRFPRLSPVAFGLLIVVTLYAFASTLWPVKDDIAKNSTWLFPLLQGTTLCLSLACLFFRPHASVTSMIAGYGVLMAADLTYECEEHFPYPADPLVDYLWIAALVLILHGVWQALRSGSAIQVPWSQPERTLESTGTRITTALCVVSLAIIATGLLVGELRARVPSSDKLTDSTNALDRSREADSHANTDNFNHESDTTSSVYLERELGYQRRWAGAGVLVWLTLTSVLITWVGKGTETTLTVFHEGLPSLFGVEPPKPTPSEDVFWTGMSLDEVCKWIQIEVSTYKQNHIPLGPDRFLDRGRWEPQILDVKPLCFAVMPFEPTWSLSVFKKIEAAAESASMSCLRADSIKGPGDIVEDIWSQIRQAHVVVADVTGRTGNVLYEVGIAHALGRPTILIAQSSEDMVFDISKQRAILYRNDDTGLSDLEPLLAEYLKAALQHWKAAVGRA